MTPRFSAEEAQELSRLLFEAREQVDMWGDVVAIRNREDAYVRGVRDRIDAYRAAAGWNPDGFGGETG